MTALDLVSFDIRSAFEGEKFQTALQWLPKEEHASVTRFKFERDQHLALANLLIRRHYFSTLLKVPWHELQFDRMPGGKPFLKNHSNIDYNTSHEGNWVIFGASNEIKIGVDVVCIDRPKNTLIDAFIKSFQPQLTHGEMKFIMDRENEDIQLRTFFELWACKESYTKALGVGLSLDLNNLDFYNEQNQIKMNFEGKKLESWCYQLSYLDESTLAVVCCGNESSSDRKLDYLFMNTRLLGDEKPLHIKNSSFHQLKYQDIKHNSWMSR